MPIRDGNLKASIQLDNKSAMREVRNSNREVVRTGGTAKTCGYRLSHLGEKEAKFPQTMTPVE